MRSLLCIGFAFLFLTRLGAEALVIPPPGWEPKPSPLASELAEPGGRLKVFVSQYPKSFNYMLDLNVFSGQLFNHMFENLIGQNPLTLEPEPALAENITVSDDKKVFTFTLHPDAKWSDGKPVTADDVIWSFGAIMNDEHLTGAHKVGLDRFNPPVKLDERSVQFTAKEVHWRNLWAAGGFPILPKHWWEKQDFNKVNFEFPVVSGPFRITHLNEPHSVVIKRRPDYWAKDDPRAEGLGNFDEIEYFFYGERDLAWDNFLRGEFDLFAVYTARRWATQTSGERFDNNWIVKQAIHNQDALGFQGFAMNLRRPLFQDIRVRRALAHLLDRERMNATLMYNQYILSRSYYEDIHPDGNPIPLIPFDVEKARALLAEAGWAVGADGKLSKDGNKFLIKFLTRDPTSDRFLLIYSEDLAKVGIDLEIVRKDWSAWSNDMDEYNYDMTWASWGGGTFKDPEPMWHSKYVDQPSGINITGYKNPKVDELIDSTIAEFDVEVRHAAVRKIDAILAEDVPYVLLWHIDYVRLLSWNKFGAPPHLLGKFGDEFAAESYWWIDPDMEADLDAARSNKTKLPGRPARVDFHKVFQMPAAAEPLQ
jgi:microcin C transport system substrate-binding protein